MKDGKSHVIPYRFGGNGFWYNAQMFEDNGWEEPVTYQELLDLCAEIKAAGITPIMFTGTFAPICSPTLSIPHVRADRRPLSDVRRYGQPGGQFLDRAGGQAGH